MTTTDPIDETRRAAPSFADVEDLGVPPPPKANDAAAIGNDKEVLRELPVIETIGVAEIFAPLGPIPWVIQGLKIASGAPTCFAGYGYSGKSLFAQELALCVASNKSVFGIHHVKRGRALHLDYEQGRRVTSDRYQRLAHAKGINPAELGDSLRLGVFPNAHLPDFADMFERTIEGFHFVVIDSLRASAPQLDENSSEMRQAIDPLGRISEKTGATIVFIHHNRKVDPTKKGAPVKQSIRGSSGIFDAFGTVFILSGEKGEPVEVSHEKCRHTGREVNDFRFTMVDTDNDRGLKLCHMEKEQETVPEASVAPTRRARGKGHASEPPDFKRRA